MLLTALLSMVSLQPQVAVEPKSTGEVKAFTLHLHPEWATSLPAISKVYVARKVYEDGSSSTYVRAEPGAGFFETMSEFGEARIDRNPKGFPVRLARQQYVFERSPKTGRIDLRTKMVFGTKDLAMRPSKRSLSGAIEPSPLDHAPTKPGKELFVDPLEWLAFGTASFSESWRLPGENDDPNLKEAAYIYSLGTARFAQRPFQGDRRALIVVPMSTFGADNRTISRRNGQIVSITNDSYPSGEVYYRPDRSLAAYLPFPTFGRLEYFTGHPSSTGGPYVRWIGHQGKNVPVGAQSYYVPAAVTAEERARLLAMV